MSLKFALKQHTCLLQLHPTTWHFGYNCTLPACMSVRVASHQHLWLNQLQLTYKHICSSWSWISRYICNTCLRSSVELCPYACTQPQRFSTGPRSAVGNVSDNRCESDCRSRGREFDPGRSHIFVEIDHEIIHMVILLPSAESFKKGCCQCTKFWLTAYSSLPRKKCG